MVQTFKLFGASQDAKKRKKERREGGKEEKKKGGKAISSEALLLLFVYNWSEVRNLCWICHDIKTGFQIVYFHKLTSKQALLILCKAGPEKIPWVNIA